MKKKLSLAEKQELLTCEATLKRWKKATFEAGKALKVIRDKKLYRQKHANFGDYCLEVWGFSRQRGNQLILAYQRYQSIKKDLEFNPYLFVEGDAENDNNCCLFEKVELPCNEGQLRGLTGKAADAPQQWREYFKQSVKSLRETNKAQQEKLTTQGVQLAFRFPTVRISPEEIEAMKAHPVRVVPVSDVYEMVIQLVRKDKSNSRC